MQINKQTTPNISFNFPPKFKSIKKSSHKKIYSKISFQSFPIFFPLGNLNKKKSKKFNR